MEWSGQSRSGGGISLMNTLVTNNEREFRRVRGLKAENWAV